MADPVISSATQAVEATVIKAVESTETGVLAYIKANYVKVFLIVAGVAAVVAVAVYKLI